MRLANRLDRSVLLVDEGAIDIAEASGGRFGSDPGAVFDAWDELRQWADGVDHALAKPYSAAELSAPVPRPRQVFAVALNYRPHAAEAGFLAPDQPLVFTKFQSSLAGPGGSIELPAGHVDWELEMVAVIGRDAHRVRPEDGWEPVVGLTVGQDLSERLTQSAGTPAQFSLGKSFPGFGPAGPAIVSLDEIPNRDDLELTCELSGEVVQRDRTANMIFPVPVLVSFISGICPLYPGDLIFTGTPAGVGNRRNPQRFITADDVLVSRIEHLGEMSHRFHEIPVADDASEPIAAR